MKRRAPHSAARHKSGAGPLHPDVEMGASGISHPERQPCGYGVPRAQCRVGCGYICRRAEDGGRIR